RRLRRRAHHPAPGHPELVYWALSAPRARARDREDPRLVLFMDDVGLVSARDLLQGRPRAVSRLADAPWPHPGGARLLPRGLRDAVSIRAQRPAPSADGPARRPRPHDDRLG